MEWGRGKERKGSKERCKHCGGIRDVWLRSQGSFQLINHGLIIVSLDVQRMEPSNREWRAYYTESCFTAVLLTGI
jgi:hypothetical protein